VTPKKFALPFEIQGAGYRKINMKKYLIRFIGLRTMSKNCIDGVGVGLTVVKKFMTIMRVRVYVESKLGGGTCFTLEFEKWAGKDSV
jgi:light-regulated signal transduction histidine kinase (bacteriophytochrome)